MSDSNDNKPKDVPEDLEKIATERRQFMGKVGVTAGVVGAAALGLGAMTPRAEAKNRILARIQEQIKKDELEDPAGYEKSTTTHDKYTKGST